MATVEQELRVTQCYAQHVVGESTEQEGYNFLGKSFVCKKCGDLVKNLKEPNEILCDGVEIVTTLSFLI